MQLRGKIWVGITGIFIGDLLGLPLGGLTGFLVGSLLGHIFIDVPGERDEETSEYQEYQQKQGRFIFHVMALCAKVAKVDGVVNRNELNFMDRLMRQQFRLNDRGRADAIRIWNNAKDSEVPFDRYARAFYEAFAQERYQINNMMDLLFAVAASDGGLSPREEELLLRAAHTFRISRMQYDRIKSRFFHVPPPKQAAYTPMDPYYAILGAIPSDTLEVIKQKYRALALKWHPDKISATGASSDAQRHAKEKFQQINEAYERISESKQRPSSRS